MASLTLNIKTDKRSSEETANGVRYDCTYVAVCDTALDAAQVRNLLATATPDSLTFGQAHPIDLVAKLNSIKVEAKDESKLVWTVDAVFEQPSPGGSIPGDPMLRPPEVRWGGETEIRSQFIDESSPPKPIVNSAGETFDTLPQREYGELVLSYTRNELYPNKADLRDCMHRVNTTGFTIDGESIPAGYAKIHVEDCTKIREGAYTFYRVTYVFKFRQQVLGAPTSATVGWNPTQLLNYGYFGLSGGGRVSILDEEGMPTRKPWPLDDAGVPKPNANDTPGQLAFNQYKTFDFTVFGFS